MTAGTDAKSCTLRVTSASPLSTAVAAMIESKAAIVLPTLSARVHIAAQCSAVCKVKGRTRFSKAFCSDSSHWYSSCFRRDGASLFTPRCNSAITIAAVNRSASARIPLSEQPALCHVKNGTKLSRGANFRCLIGFSGWLPPSQGLGWDLAFRRLRLNRARSPILA